MFTLISVFESCNSITSQRQQEYIRILQKNRNNPMINKIIYFWKGTKQDGNPFVRRISRIASNKHNTPIIIVYQDKYVTFKNIIDYANKRLPNTKIIVSYADISFDENKGLTGLKSVRFNHIILALTRYDYFGPIKSLLDKAPYLRGQFSKTSRNNIIVSRPTGDHISTWIFQTPFNPDFKTDILINGPKTGGYLNHQMLSSMDYEVYNPCLEVITLHHHNGWENEKVGSYTINNKTYDTREYHDYMKKNEYFIERLPFTKIDLVKERH